ncbi:hypothetical protein V2J09_023364 [Rumex salicifolius]
MISRAIGVSTSFDLMTHIPKSTIGSNDTIFRVAVDFRSFAVGTEAKSFASWRSRTSGLGCVNAGIGSGTKPGWGKVTATEAGADFRIRANWRWRRRWFWISLEETRLAIQIRANASVSWSEVDG